MQSQKAFWTSKISTNLSYMKSFRRIGLKLSKIGQFIQQAFVNLILNLWNFQSMKILFTNIEILWILRSFCITSLWTLKIRFSQNSSFPVKPRYCRSVLIHCQASWKYSKFLSKPQQIFQKLFLFYKTSSKHSVAEFKLATI